MLLSCSDYKLIQMCTYIGCIYIYAAGRSLDVRTLRVGFAMYCTNPDTSLFMIFSLSNIFTVETVLTGTVLSGHPLLSGHGAKSQKFRHTNTIKVILIERSPLLSGRGFHHPDLNFSLF